MHSTLPNRVAISPPQDSLQRFLRLKKRLRQGRGEPLLGRPGFTSIRQASLVFMAARMARPANRIGRLIQKGTRR